MDHAPAAAEPPLSVPLHRPPGEAIGSGSDPTPRLPTVSVIVPIWNDAEQLRQVMGVLSRMKRVKEVIVADASDGPESRDIALGGGAAVVCCPHPNRGEQLNMAVAHATGDVLLFQHSDTEISDAHVESLRRTMADPSVVGGAFHRKFDPVLHRRRQWMTGWVRRMNSKGTLYGDQSIFVRRDHFERMGRFRDYPMMEDMDFSKRLRKSGRVEVIDPPLLSSSRRHKVYGSWRTSLEGLTVLWLYRLGVSPHWIHRKYYRRGKKGRAGPEGPVSETGRSVHEGGGRVAVQSPAVELPRATTEATGQ